MTIKDSMINYHPHFELLDKSFFIHNKTCLSTEVISFKFMYFWLMMWLDAVETSVVFTSFNYPLGPYEFSHDYKLCY